MEKVYLCLGGNIGDTRNYLQNAVAMIGRRIGRVVSQSAVYQSEPWGFKAEEWFLNRVIVLETEMNPEPLLEALLEIERELGRVRHPEIQGYTSRTADLDILYYGNRIVLTDILTIPHPRLHQRRFALLPLCEVAPQLVHPAFNFTQTELLRRCHDFSEVRKIENVCNTTT
jgi:2-amino-4-hydroxy-6-hydroxymethyldihydropteridine diphosphokinase